MASMLVMYGYMYFLSWRKPVGNMASSADGIDSLRAGGTRLEGRGDGKDDLDRI